MIYNKRISENANAKINLYLDVVSKRDDGFHDIRSVMQSVSLSDQIEISISEAEGDILTCNDSSIPTDGKNIVIKAANAFRKAINEDFSVKIHLEKSIPSAAGLGGGSSDGAAVLRALNYLSESFLSDEKLIEISASVGADLPFCLFGGTYLCEGKGEKLKKINACPEFYCVIAIKGEGVSTPWAYGKLDKIYGDFKGERDGGKLSIMLDALRENNKEGVSLGIFNVFESTVEPQRKEVSSLKKILLKNGASAAMMSGSGPSVFGLFENECSAIKALYELKKYGAKAYFCKTL